MRLKFQLILVLLTVIVWIDAIAAPSPTNTASTSRVLMIDASSMPITAGKVTLTIGALRRTNGVYAGEYKISVAPYFYKNEKGRLAIVAPDDTLAALSQGKVATITGTSTTSGSAGKSRHIDATATPADIDHGKLKLWFTAGDRKMTFEPAYHFAENGAAAVPATMTKTNHLPPISHR